MSGTEASGHARINNRYRDCTDTLLRCVLPLPLDISTSEFVDCITKNVVITIGPHGSSVVWDSCIIFVWPIGSRVETCRHELVWGLGFRVFGKLLGPTNPQFTATWPDSPKTQ